MNLLKKSLSVVLAVLMLASVCSCLMMSVSAYDVKNYEDGLVVLENDFNNGKGMADYRDDISYASTTSIEEEADGNKYVYFTNKNYQGHSSMLGTPEAELTGSTANVQHPHRFRVYVPGTYTVSLKWKVFAGSIRANDATEEPQKSQIMIQYYKAGHAMVGGISKTGAGSSTYDVVSDYEEVDIDGSVYRKTTKDTEWMSATFNVTYTAQDIADGRDGFCFTVSAGGKATGLDKGIVKIGLDDVVIKVSSATVTAPSVGATYVYDFKDKDGKLMTPIGTFGDRYNFGWDDATTNGSHAWFSNSNTGNGSKSFITDKGAVLHSTTGGIAQEAKGTNTGSWAHKLYLKDPDFAIGNGDNGTLRMQAGHYYYVEAYIRSYAGKAADGVTDIANAESFNASIVLSASNMSAGSTCEIGRVASVGVSSKGTQTVLAATIDADDTSWTTRGCNNVGRYIGIAVDTGKYLLIEKVVVTVYDKANLGGIEAKDSEVSLNLDNRFNDLYFPLGDQLNVAHLDVVEDPTNSGKGNVLESKMYPTYGSTMAFGIAKAPGQGGFLNRTPSFAQPEGFKAEAGHKYRITFDAYISEYNDKFGGYSVFLSQQDAVYKYIEGHKTCQTESYKENLDGKAVLEKAGTGEWTTVVIEFTANAANVAAGQEYILIGVGVPAKTAGEYSMIHYLDNINVVDITDSAGDTVENAKRSIRAASGSGENYVSAGIRFRGEIATATVENAASVGFIVAPEELIKNYNGTEKWFNITNGKAAFANASIVNATNKIYGTNGDNTQYQLLIKKLTKEGVEKNLLATNFVVKMYVKDSEGNYTYYDVATSSYNEVREAYGVKDFNNWAKY